MTAEMSEITTIYARVSSEGDRQSTGRKVTDLESYAVRAGLEVVRVFEET